LVSADLSLSPVIAATARWLLAAYPASGGPFSAALAEVQARQAVTAAAWLRYPTAMDAGLVAMAGPGGSDGLDRAVGAEPGDAVGAWRSWVDETVASWAACLLGSPELARRAVAAVAGCEHATVPAPGFHRLVEPDGRACRAAVLLRHPDLLAPVADLHRAELLARLDGDLDPAAGRVGA
jgi:hypothetical protein